MYVRKLLCPNKWGMAVLLDRIGMERGESCARVACASADVYRLSS